MPDVLNIHRAPINTDLTEQALQAGLISLPKGSSWILVVHPYQEALAWVTGMNCGLDIPAFHVEICPALTREAWCLWVDGNHAYYSPGA